MGYTHNGCAFIARQPLFSRCRFLSDRRSIALLCAFRLHIVCIVNYTYAFSLKNTISLLVFFLFCAFCIRFSLCTFVCCFLLCRLSFSIGNHGNIQKPRVTFSVSLLAIPFSSFFVCCAHPLCLSSVVCFGLLLFLPFPALLVHSPAIFISIACNFRTPISAKCSEGEGGL